MDAVDQSRFDIRGVAGLLKALASRQEPCGVDLSSSVAHASRTYNQVRIDERQSVIAEAYRQFAPRQEGDERYDVRHLLEQLRP